jgi:hypothetical protein
MFIFVFFCHRHIEGTETRTDVAFYFMPRAEKWYTLFSKILIPILVFIFLFFSVFFAPIPWHQFHVQMYIGM